MTAGKGVGRCKLQGVGLGPDCQHPQKETDRLHDTNDGVFKVCTLWEAPCRIDDRGLMAGMKRLQKLGPETGTQLARAAICVPIPDSRFHDTEALIEYDGV